MANVQNSSEDIEIFFSYSHQDEKLRDELEKHLSILKRLGLISAWHDRKIGAGNEWKSQIDEHLNSAHIILLLISPDFLNSDYCYDIEMQRAVDRHDLGEARVIPVILRPVDWNGAPFSKLQALPTNAEPVVSKNWGSLDEAFYDIAKGIRKEIENLKSVSKAPKLVHRTIIVDQMHRGDYPSIVQAVEAAKPGDCIFVRHGLYQECVVIDKPLEIIGEGERNEIEIRANNNNAVIFKTNYGKISNLTLRQMSYGDKLACVDILSGRLIIEGCDISSQSDACIMIHKDADPRLRKNQINDCIGVGVFIVDGGQGLFEENHFLRNSTSILVIGNSRPTFLRNVIRLNSGSGIILSNNCLGLLEENVISNNSSIGVVIKSGSNPTLRNNKIHDNAMDGVCIIENGGGIFEENDIFRNINGLYISSSNPTLRKNLIHEGRGNGIQFNNNAQGIIEENDIFGNDGEISVFGGSNPIIKHNKIHNSKCSGVYLWSGVQCTLEHNNIYENNYYGVSVSANANPKLRHNRIYKNGMWAIEISDGGCGTFEYNDLRSNKYGAWKLSEDTKSKINSFLNEER